MPGAIFYDTWIKRDPVAAFFCIAALYILLRTRKKEWLCGVFLGLALLGKENALFYAAAVFLIIVADFKKGRCLQRLGMVFGSAFIVSAWWFLFFSRSVKGFKAFFIGESIEAGGFDAGQWYYLLKLPDDSGLPVFILLVLGLLVLVYKNRYLFTAKGRLSWKPVRLLPIILLVPGYLILSISKGKPAWGNIILFPALAIIAAYGWSALSSWIDRFPLIFREVKYRHKTLLSGAILILILIVPVLKFSYIKYFEEVDAGQILLARTSLEKVGLINEYVKDDEQLLIFPSLYLNGPHLRDPIFFWKLSTFPKIIYVEKVGDYKLLKEYIVENKIHWLLMSPVKEGLQKDYLDQMIVDFFPPMHLYSQGVLVHTEMLWKNDLL